MMKKVILFLCLALCVTKMTAQQKELIDKVVARVGDEYVLLSEVEEQFSYAKEQRKDVPDNYRCTIIDQILVSKLLVAQAKIDSLYPKDDELEQQLTARFEKILDYMGGNEQQFIDYYGQTPGAMKESMRDDMRDQIMGDKMKAKVLADAVITPAEVREFFNKIPKDSLPYFNQEVEISEIVVKAKANEAQKNLAKEKLNDMREKITSGKVPFEDLAKNFSQDPGSGRDGGNLGWTKRGKFVPEFEAAAYKLEPGQISEVFESEYGFHIIQLLDRRGNTIHTRHILIKPEVTDEDFLLARHTLDSVRNLIVRDSMTFSYAVKHFGDKNSQSFHSDGRMTNPTSGNNIFETRDLDPDTYFAIDTMKVNSISSSLEVALPTGEKYYRIIKLNSKSSPHKANLTQDYSKIQTAALEQKKNLSLAKWIERRAQNTFVQIDPMFKNCPNLDKWLKKTKL